MAKGDNSKRRVRINKNIPFYRRRIFKTGAGCLLVLAGIVVGVIFIVKACVSDSHRDAERQRYESVERIAEGYAEMLLATKADSHEAVRRLLDIRSRASLLAAEGDTALSIFFLQSIESQVRSANPTHADDLFGPEPTENIHD